MKNNHSKQILCKFLKLMHVLLAAIAVGGTFSVLILLLARSEVKIKGSQSMFSLDFGTLILFSKGITYAFTALIISSVLFEFFTEWSAFAKPWLAIKWLIVSAMAAVFWLKVGPTIAGLAAISDGGLQTASMQAKYDTLASKAIIYTSFELLLLVIAAIISIYKPFGNFKKSIIVKRVPLAVLLASIVTIIALVSLFNGIRLETYRKMIIKNSDLSAKSDGIYHGTAKVGNYVYIVYVTIKQHRIIRINAIKPREDSYAEYAKGVFNKIIEKQNANTDVITGATTTSKAYMKAVEKALK